MRMRREAVRILGAAVALTTVACGRDTAREATDAGAPLPVVSAVASLASVSETFEAGGVLAGQAHAAVAARVMAPVLAVDVEPGDEVRAGQTLVRLDDRDLDARSREAVAYETAAARGQERARSELAAAEAAATLARSTFTRISTLHGRRSATDQELDEARASVAAAESRRSAAEAAVAQATAGASAASAAREAAGATASYAEVTAPFAGTVTETLVDPGALATPGMVLVRVEDTSRLDLEVRLDESRAAWAGVGDEIPVVLETRDGPVERVGRVTEVARAVDADARAVRITIRLSEVASLRPGMFGRARFPGPDRMGLLVPAGSVITRGQLTSVFVVDGGRARLRLVRVGRTVGGRTEVLAGLSDGESVVVDPEPALHDGAGVQARSVSGGQS